MSYIGQVNIDNSPIPVGSTLYGICEADQAASSTLKQVTLGNFDVAIAGVTIHVKFINGNTASTLYLKVGTVTGPDNGGFLVISVGPMNWPQNTVVSLTFEDNNVGDSYWRVNGIILNPSDYALAGHTHEAYAASNHTHGSITNDGKLNTSTPSLAVITDSNGAITTSDLAVSDPTATTNTNGTVTSFISNISLNSLGQISATKTTLPEASTTVAGIILIGSGSTNALAGDSTISIAGNTVNLANGSITAATLRTSLDLSTAMHFRGIATVAITEGSTTDPTISGYTFGTNGASASTGDVILDSDHEYEYVWTSEGWEKLGSSSSYALSSSVILKSTLTTAGDIIYANSSIEPTRLGIGTSGQVLLVNSGLPSWQTLTASSVGLGNVTNVAQLPKPSNLTTGDIFYWSSNSTTARLAIGNVNLVLTVGSDGVPEWASAGSSADEKVKLSPYSTTHNDPTVFHLLLKHSNNTTEETNGVYYSTIEGKTIEFDASTGTLSTTKFSGNGSLLTNLSWSAINAPTATSSAAGIVKIGSTISTTTNYDAISIDANGVIYAPLAHLYLTNSAGTSNTSLNNGEVYLKLIQGGTARGAYNIKGTTGIDVSVNSSGNLEFKTKLISILGLTNAPQAADNQYIGFVHSGVLYLKKFDTYTEPVSS